MVVRGAEGVAYATSADGQGRFVLGMGSPSVDTLFVVETQTGQDAAPAPYRLLVTRDIGGPIALLTPGGASRRLDSAGPLDVIDGDGRAILASGRSMPRSRVPFTAGGMAKVEITTGANGRWTAPLEGGSTTLAVGGRSYARPASQSPAAPTPLSVVADSGGRVVRWATPGGATQQSWFPDANSGLVGP